MMEDFLKGYLNRNPTPEEVKAAEAFFDLLESRKETTNDVQTQSQT